MPKFALLPILVGVLSSVVMPTSFAATNVKNTQTVSGTIYKQSNGTTFDTWNLNVLTPGSIKVDVLAYEASQKQTNDPGYSTSDLNGDGEITFLDPEVTIYSGSGALGTSSYLARCDDVANNCSPFSNATLSVSDAGSSASTDGSIFLRDPVFNMTFTAPGQYRLLIADYRLTATEAATGINTNDTLTLPTGLPIRDHGDYRITLSSPTLNFSVDGNTISAVPELEEWALMLGGLGLIGWRSSQRQRGHRQPLIVGVYA